VAAAVFRLAVVLLPLCGPTIFSLGFALVSQIAGASALIAAIRLPPEAAAADIKIKCTPPALN
jgi:hypothetical protein